MELYSATIWMEKKTAAGSFMRRNPGAKMGCGRLDGVLGCWVEFGELQLFQIGRELSHHGQPK